MTSSIHAAAQVPGRPGTHVADGSYRPGTCNIGPEEIARRRLAGHIGLAAAIGLFVVLMAAGVPALARIVVALPAAAAGSGYLQAWLKFCAAFGSRGVFNFGRLGQTQRVVDDDARRRDRARAKQIGLASLAIGVAVGLAAVVVPL